MFIVNNHVQTDSGEHSLLKTIRNRVAGDFAQVNDLILQSLQTEVPLIAKIAEHILNSGGKRLRPLLTLLTAKLLHYQGSQHIALAAIIEFLHTATLLHDDVVDVSSLRRGQSTANAIWGNQYSILTGDFLYSRAFQLMTSLQHMPILQILADATNTIAEGEMIQLMNRHNPEVTESHYMQVISAKTATLFAAAVEVGAVIASATPQEQKWLSQYGLHLGMAFQMIDDWLDYAIAPEKSGKNIGDDLAEGKATLPLIYALQHATAAEAELIRSAIRQGGLDDLGAIMTILENTQAFAYVRQQAQHQADLAKKALQFLPPSPYKEALLGLTQVAIERNH